MRFGNWSVLHWHCITLRFMLIEPTRPKSMAITIPCSKLWPANVA